MDSKPIRESPPSTTDGAGRQVRKRLSYRTARKAVVFVLAGLIVAFDFGSPWLPDMPVGLQSLLCSVLLLAVFWQGRARTTVAAPEGPSSPPSPLSRSLSVLAFARAACRR